jgi:serine/threonine protein phosphatase PrpC
MKLVAHGFCHIGTKRKENQDVILMDDKLIRDDIRRVKTNGNTRFFVADGVGGSLAGDIASWFVLKNLNETISKDNFPEPETIEMILREINAGLIDKSKQFKEFEGMATTLSGVFISEKQFTVVNAGDSRVYHYRNNQLHQLTKDDSFNNILGISSIINFFGGYANTVTPSITTSVDQIESGDIMLITTDGILRCFTDEQLKNVLSAKCSLAEKSGFLLQKALKTGAPDNISCIFVERAP